MSGRVKGDDGVLFGQAARIGPHDRADWVKPWMSTTGSPVSPQLGVQHGTILA